jgi:DNA-binding transcriptional LysR family regulator
MPHATQHLDDIAMFVEVARAGGFLRAAKQLGRSGSAVSKAIARLEEQLQVRLFLRTTRRIALTSEGAGYLSECERILLELEQAGEHAAEQRKSPSGVVRVQFPLLWGRETVIAGLRSFQQSFPDIELQFLFTEREIDLIEERIDIAVRVGASDDKNLMTKALVQTRSCVVGADSYLARAGTPSVPEDLQRHQCIHFLLPDGYQPLPWHLSLGGAVRYHVAHAPPLLLNDPYAMRDAAIAGLGLAQGPDFLFGEALKAGLLRRVLQRWEMAGPTICLVWAQNQFVPRRCRVFIDWISELIKRQAGAMEH